MVFIQPVHSLQVRETPYKDKAYPSASIKYQPPRKFIFDWDLYVQENLGGAGPPGMFTDEYLFDMFVRALAVFHAYMRRLGVLPAGKNLCVSIKRRTRTAKNKAGKEDKKVSLHATVHIMEPAERHKVVVQKVFELIRKDKPYAHKVMTEKDALQKGIPDPGRCVYYNSNLDMKSFAAAAAAAASLRARFSCNLFLPASNAACVSNLPGGTCPANICGSADGLFTNLGTGGIFATGPFDLGVGGVVGGAPKYCINPLNRLT